MTRKKIVIPRGAVLVNPGRNWFKTVMPKFGAKANYWRVNSKGAGVVERYPYLGKNSLTIGGIRYAAYRIQSERGVMWVSKDNFPLKMEMPLSSGLDMQVVAKKVSGRSAK